MQLDERLLDVIGEAHEYCQSLGHPRVTSYHVLMGMVRKGDVTKTLLAKYGIGENLDALIKAKNPVPQGYNAAAAAPFYSTQMISIRSAAFAIALDMTGEEVVTEQHMLLAMLKRPGAASSVYIRPFVPINIIRDELLDLTPDKKKPFVNQVKIEEITDEDSNSDGKQVRLDCNVQGSPDTKINQWDFNIWG